MRIVALMSGTSFDAIDAAAAEFRLDGDVLELTPLGAVGVGYEPGLRREIAAALPPGALSMAEVCELDTRLGQAYAAAARQALDEYCAGRADLVVSPGQTLYHWVAGGRARGTLQLGQPAWVAAAAGCPVLSDLRAADIAAGGQGAPLVPAFDALLLAGSVPSAGALATLNLGGIANITVVTAGGSPLGYDVGPGNALLDAVSGRYFGTPSDLDGRYAAAGRVDPRLLALLLADPFYATAAPKSTGKERFNAGYVDSALGRLGRPVEPADLLATLVELTARTVVDACLAHRVVEVFVSGGGVRNPVVMAALHRLAAGRFRVATSAELGIDEQAKEAYAFALLGWLSWHGLPAAVPSVTGARQPALLGSLTPGGGPLRLPEPRPTAPVALRVQPARVSDVRRSHPLREVDHPDYTGAS